MEFVYVVPRGELFPDCYPHGLIALGNATEASAFAGHFESIVRERGFFVERDYAERNPAWKQVIPYTIVMRGDEVLLLRRLTGGGDARLHDKLSIGVGGHINPEDLDPAEVGAAAPGRSDVDSQPADSAGTRSASRTDPVAAGTRRELDEELVIEGNYDLRMVGILNDESNPVGAVHVGWVQVLQLESTGNARIREHEVLEGSFVSRDHLSSLLSEGANFETWSSLLVQRMDDILSQPLSAVS